MQASNHADEVREHAVGSKSIEWLEGGLSGAPLSPTISG
jgi:hypothetical protein